MKMALGDIYGMCSPSHGQALVKFSGMPFPVKTAYRVSKIVRILLAEYQLVEDQRRKMVQEMGEASEDGETVVSEKNKAQFLEDLNDLLTEEVEVDFEPLKFSEIGGDIVLSAQEFAILEKLFDMEE